MNGIYAPLRDLADFGTIEKIVHGGDALTESGCVSLTGCVDGQKNHLISALSEGIRTKVIVTYDDIRARAIWEEYKFYDRDVCFYPAKDLIFFQADIHGNQLTQERVRTLRRVLEAKPVTIVTTFAALMTPQVIYDRNSAVLSLRMGKEINVTDVSLKLINLGYEKRAQVDSPGQFAVRGDILDIYDLTEDNPVRISLWGDEIESIRRFDVFSQRSIEQLEEIAIYPATEFILSREQLEEGILKIEKEEKKRTAKLREQFLTEEAHRLHKTVAELRETALEFHGHVSIESYLPYFYPEGKGTGCIASLPEQLRELGGDSVVFYIDEPLRAQEQAKAIEFEFGESYAQRLEKGYILPGQMKILYGGSEIAAKIAQSPVVTLSTLDSGPGFFVPKYKFDMNARNISSYMGSFEALSKDLDQFRRKGYRVLLLSSSRSRGARLAEDLRDLEIPAVYSENPMRQIVPGEVEICYGHIEKGFEYPLIQFVVLTEDDIFGARKQKKKRRRYSSAQGQEISALDDLHPGDYVIHEGYGMGIYRGIEKVESGNVVRDYIKLEYKDGGTLYVLATELDTLQKYASSDADKQPKLNKLGTKEWEKTKAKVRTSVEVVAKELVELYARRQQAEGFCYGPDTVWQKEFEELFPYEETEDQMAAIRDTKADMESGRIMDRLVCGDVGFGKTEIAIRAAFKAVQEGKQVAYLVPTTILAQQHFTTFSQRMKDFPVRVELLSRFRTPSEIKRTIEDLKKGLVDIVIGTHRLLSNDVAYKDLGLLIIDEEQRFGVTHKEKIKQMRENVDVLTLSATPIPRTLHMSLVGIRDMSLLEEAPQDRLPIQTFVCEYDEELVREAITREIGRGGQVYYVFNRINMIADVAARLQEKIPDATISYAHGQMSERELENIMVDFVNGDIDVLVSTTIIETGMDISNANTLIIQDADRMGLSQLYQLRGRVGRSNRMAYAFLMYKRDKILSEVAEARLGAIREFTDLGSGFRIAMRDLEIRGAGNLLGKSQSGHMEAVGYDLYCKMLNEQVSLLKGHTLPEQFSTVITLDVNAHIPAEYIFNEEQKLDMYKRISCIANEKDRQEIRDELIDRFGNLPKEAENLLRVALLRAMAHSLDLTEVRGKDGEIVFTFRPDARVKAEAIPELLGRYGRSMNFVPYGKPHITVKYEQEMLVSNEAKKLLEVTEAVLRDMRELLIPEGDL